MSVYDQRRAGARQALRRLDPSSSALMLIDMQVDYLDDEGAFARRGIDVTPARAIVPHLREALDAFRSRHLPVFHTQYVVFPEYDDIVDAHRVVGSLLENIDSRRCVRGTRGVELIEELTPSPDETVVQKPAVLSGFAGTGLGDLLRKRGVRSLLVGGVAAHACVLATCSDAFSRDLDVLVIEDGVAAYEQHLRDLTVHFAEMVYGPPVLASEIVEWLAVGAS